MLALSTSIAIYSRRYSHSVADFLAANRCAERYLLSISQGIAGVGSISIIAGFEMYYQAGFTAAWWQLLQIVVFTLVFLSGWIAYRYRQTRALTLAQFLEIRYSKRFRVFTGIIAWISGMVNFGIFPAVGASFFMYFCGLPDFLSVGGVHVPIFPLVIIILLGFALFFTLIGGQITIMITDFVQGMFCNLMFVIIMIVALLIFTWPQISSALTMAPPDASLVHPYHTSEAKDFNLWFYLILAFGVLYSEQIWQGSQGFNSSAINAHEARMGKILSTWRLLSMNLFMIVLPICVYTFMHHPDYAAQANQVRESIAAISNPTIQTQMLTPIAMRHFLPTGILGGFAAVMLAAFISNCDTYLHSWGSIFVQDVILPFRRKSLSPRGHIHLLRFSVFAVAIFIFIFSLLFRQTEYIYMFFYITGAIFLGGAGAVVIGGLYWKRGTTAAAWSAMITGSTLAVTAVIIRQIHQTSPFTGIMGKIASYNGAILGFLASLSAILIYILVSLVKPEIFNLDRMLHRGKYMVLEPENVSVAKKTGKLQSIIGITDEFSVWDKIIYISTLVWSGLLALLFILGTVYNYMTEVPQGSWLDFWKYYVLSLLILSILTTIWFAIGGIFDVKRFFKRLSSIKRDDDDDGLVQHLQEDSGQEK